MRRLFTILAVFGGTLIAAADVELAVRGRTPDFTIVVPSASSEVETYAAEELQSHLERATGVRLPIASDDKEPPERAVLVGKTRFSAKALAMNDSDAARLGEDGFRLAVRGSRVIVYGNAGRGVLYGVYELLERFAGCRWYASCHTIQPQRAKVAFPEGYDDVQVPDYDVRCVWWYDALGHADFAARLRMNSKPWGKIEKKFGGDAFRFSQRLSVAHTFNTLLPPETYMKSHPEYYSSTGDRVQPCLTNPDVLRIVRENLLEQIRKEPEARVFGVSQNDWRNYCTCPRCAAVDKEEGSHSGTLVRFVNALADEVARRYPDKLLETLAYQYTRQPPAKTKLRPNVVLCICPIECDYARPIPESPFPKNAAFADDLRGWHARADRFYVWDYVTNFRHYPHAFANGYSLQGNLAFYQSCGVKRIFSEGAYQGSLADFAELKAWLLAKLMWRVNQPVEPLLDDFFNGFYGPAAPYVRAYFETVHGLQRSMSRNPQRPLLIYQHLDTADLPDEAYTLADRLFDEARGAVRDAEPIYGRNVRRAAFSVDYTRFGRLEKKGTCLLWFSRKAPDGESAALRTRLAKRLLSTIEEVGDARLSESRVRNAEKFREIREAATNEVALPLRRVTCGIIEEKDLGFCKTPAEGALVDDPAADDGRALKLYNTHFEWSTSLPFSRIVTDPDQRLRLRVRCRVEKLPDVKKGEAFRVGVYDWGSRSGTIHSRVNVEDIPNEGYFWYNVGTFARNDRQTFWIAPGRFDKNGKSSIRSLAIDKIELTLVKGNQ